MDILRTPDDRFASLPGFPFSPHYVEVAAETGAPGNERLRLHHLDEGPRDAGETVLLLHGYGEDCKSAGWISLAKALNEKGYAVLRFDFRGHGDSKAVEPGMPNANPMLAVPGFWDQAENRTGIRGVKGRPTEIDAKHFTPGYHRILANDIAAAKAFLDK